jgi:hypothetical protein
MDQHAPAKPLVRSLRAIALALALSQGSTVADAAPVDEQATKVAMIYNFSRFTLWPDSRFASAADPVVLCVDPDAALSGPLQSVSGKPVGSRTLVVRETHHIDHGCQMAYLGGGDTSDGYIATLRDKGVLTIGETPGFTRAGAIKLVTIGRQVRFEINQSNALAAGARLSSNLLRLAVAVH